MQPRQQATMTHSLHCDLSPQMQQAHRTTHTWTTTRCRTPRDNQFDDEIRSQPQQPHTQGTLHRWLQPLYKEKHKVSCSGFLPKTNPMQQSCSHYNQRFPKSPRSPRHRFPRSPHSLRHHFPRSPLPTVTTYLRHHFHHPSSCTVVWCKVSQVYLSVTRKIASQLPLLMWCILLRDVVLCDVLLCDVLLCDVLLCDVLFCDVLLCDVLLCDVLLCDVLLCDVLLCDVLLRDVLLCDVLLRDVLLCDVLLCDVLLCDVLLLLFQSFLTRKIASQLPLTNW